MTARFPDVEIEHLRTHVARLGRQLTQAASIDSVRNYELFRARASANYALGAPILSVVKDLRCAALCLRKEAVVRLQRLEPHRLKSRRLDPIHLVLFHAEPDTVEEMAASYALPLMQYYAGAAEPLLRHEVDSLGAFFATRQLRTQRDVVALAAATYAAVLGALTRGDEREARALLTVLNESMAQWDEEPIPSGKQYLLQCAALADLLERREKDLAQRLVALATHTVRERERALESDSTSVRREGKGSPVLSIPALVGLASLMNVSVSLAPLCQSAPHLGELASLIQSDWSLVE